MGIIEDKINTAMRDFVRFTGDGKPGEPVDAALPVGDPASGEWNPPKKQVREAFVTLAGSAENVGGLLKMLKGPLFRLPPVQARRKSAKTMQRGQLPRPQQMLMLP